MILIISTLTGLLLMAYLTLLERNYIGRSQLRIGPSKVGPWGLLQPLRDAVKLFFKNRPYIIKGNRYLIIFSTVFSFFLALTAWLILATSYWGPVRFPYGVFLIILISSVRVYPILLAGWSSNSKYGIVGALRGIAQTISYEVRMIFTILCILYFLGHINLGIIWTQKTFPAIILPWLAISWFIIISAETNRAPFDLVEGERELVRGFNTEYSGTGFTLLFMAEYLHIVVLSAFSRLLFLGGFIIGALPIIVLFIISRASLPRIRMDNLIQFTWVRLLPIRVSRILMCVSAAAIASFGWHPPIVDIIYHEFFTRTLGRIYFFEVVEAKIPYLWETDTTPWWEVMEKEKITVEKFVGENKIVFTPTGWFEGSDKRPDYKAVEEWFKLTGVIDARAGWVDDW